MNVLVTGGAGFIGSNLVRALLLQNHSVTVIDNYISGKKSNEIPGITYIESDTKYINDLELPSNLDVVFHLGEYSRIHPSFEQYERVWQYNTVGTFEVLNFCKKRNIKIVYAASSTRFAEEGINHSPYSLTKYMSVELIKGFSKWFDLKYSICYFYNVFGLGHDSSPVDGYQSVISIFENQFIKGDPITVVGTGNQERMFTYVGDVVEGLIKSWHYYKNDEFDLVNPIKSYKIIDIAKMFCDNIVFIESRKGDRSSSSYQNYEDTIYKLNWNPKVSIEDWILNFKNKKNEK